LHYKYLNQSDDYKKIIHDSAIKIFDTYLLKGSKYEINISNQQIETISKILFETNDNLNGFVFNDIEKTGKNNIYL
jgi:hypothetical protein